jgi:hypothetical protein
MRLGTRKELRWVLTTITEEKEHYRNIFPRIHQQHVKGGLNLTKYFLRHYQPPGSM